MNPQPPPRPAAASPTPVAPPSSVPSGTVTFLFTDIEASTRRWEQHPVAMHAALARHDAMLRAACEPRSGYIFHTAGDAFYVAFADAATALDAAIESQKAFVDTAWDDIGPLRVRMALHTGDPLERGGDYFGPAVNRCARLVTAAHGEQIVLSRATVERLPGPLPEGVELRDLGQHRLRDLTRPEHVFQVCHPALPADFPRLRSLDSLPNNLPIQLTTFVGRRRELSTVSGLTRDHRLVTLIGPGGCGKTRLALQAAADVAKHYHDGAWLVDLSAITDADRVPQAVAMALGAREGGRPRPRQGGDDGASATAMARRFWMERLVGHLGSREMLVVLDNCEHLIDACAHLVETVLQACPAVRVLATSRESLGVPGEHVWSVPSLSHPGPERLDEVDDLIRYEAARLFIDRARSIDPEFRLTPQNAGDVAQIIRRLDGIPLAIELAAARLRILPVAEIAARLDDRFRLLTGGSRTAMPRHQTLSAAMDWSHDLLTATERALFRRLSVFGGGFSLAAAEAICSDASELTWGAANAARVEAPGGEWETVLDLVSQLVEKSLVRVDDVGGASTYRLLETIRQYGSDKLVAAGESGRFRRRHRDWYLLLAEQAAQELRGPNQDAWLDRLAVEHDNLRAALAWSLDDGDAVAALRLAGALWWFWFVRSLLSEGRDWLDRSLALADGASTDGWSSGGGSSSSGSSSSGSPGGAAPEGGPSRGGSSGEGSPGGAAPDDLRAQALLGAGALAWRQRDYAQAAEELTAGLALYRRLDDRQGVARCLYFLGRVAHFQGDHSRAWSLYEESLANARALGDGWGVAATMDVMGLLAWQQGEFSTAAAYLESSLAHARDLGDLRGIADSLNILGRMAVDRGDYEGASSLLEESIHVYESLGDDVSIAYASIKLGTIAVHRGDLAAAADRLEASLARSRELQERRALAYAHIALADVRCLSGDAGSAEVLLVEGLALAREVGDKRGIADARLGQGRLACDDGDVATTARHFVAALDLYVAMGDQLGVAEALMGLAHALVPASPESATRLYAAARSIRDHIGAPVPPVREPAEARLMAELHAALGDAAFAAAWNAGRASDVAGTVAWARVMAAGATGAV